MPNLKKSGKVNLPDQDQTPDSTNRPRCSVLIVKKYERKEGKPPRLENVKKMVGPKDRRFQVADLVLEAFGEAGLDCERYLLHALYRWIVTHGHSPDTWSTYVKRIARWICETGKRSLSSQTDTTQDDASEFLYGLEANVSQRTVAAHRDVMCSWFSWLFDRDLIRRSPMARVVVRQVRVDQARVVKADGTRQALSLTEARRMATWCLTEAAPVAGLSVLLQLSAGLRSAEVAGLERRHLVEREGVVTLTVVGKGNKSRRITLEPVVVQAWKRYVSSSRRQGERGPLLSCHGGHYDRRQIQRWAKAAAHAIGRRESISSHDLRRTAATLLIEAGGTLELAQHQLGHTHPTTTARCYVARRAPSSITTGISEGIAS